jgi:hypothetical protein
VAVALEVGVSDGVGEEVGVAEDVAVRRISVGIGGGRPVDRACATGIGGGAHPQTSTTSTARHARLRGYRRAK